ncbi:MAG TPA: hypothetical protein VNN08_02665, partial [Thermoanaerobaculia bacterium]|nr:hypothetical protein [Thermoanaerobaculia bacterium]
ALLIVGTAGAGKTVTLLQLARLALERARREGAAPVPVVLSLASWSERALTLEEWVTEEIRLRYFLPRQSARGWLDGGRLMLLLDGLDEAGAARRSDCIAAINRFRRSLPLVALAVTCREEDYAGSVKAGDVLGLDGAIGLLPLSPSQVALALAPHADREELERLVTSPLLLGVARRILTSDESPSPSAGEIDRESLQDRLFQRLVHDCLRSEERDGYGEDEAVRWLSHLARTMLHRNRTVLAVEELQPSWLVSAWSRAAYVLLSRVLAGLWIGIAAACFLGLLSHSAALARNVVADGVAGGIGVALLDGALLPRKRPVAPARKGRLTSDSLYAALAGSAAGAGVLTLHLARSAGGLFAATVFHGLLFALIFARPLRAVRFDRDVAAVETLLWSWTAALRSWVAVGLFTWSLLLLGRFSGLWPARVGAGSALLSTLPNAFFFASVPALLLGLEPGFVEGKTRPNHGIWLSARNAVLTGGLSLAGCLVSVLAGWLLARFGLIGSVQFLRNAEMRPGLLLFVAVSGFFAPLAALRFGGLDIIKHAALRLLLWRQGLCPLLFPRFLEHATRRGLLRRAGGGYLFFHSTLMAYLANMSPD